MFWAPSIEICPQNLEKPILVENKALTEPETLPRDQREREREKIIFRTLNSLEEFQFSHMAKPMGFQNVSSHLLGLKSLIRFFSKMSNIGFLKKSFPLHSTLFQPQLGFSCSWKIRRSLKPYDKWSRWLPEVFVGVEIWSPALAPKKLLAVFLVGFWVMLKEWRHDLKLFDFSFLAGDKFPIWIQIFTPHMTQKCWNLRTYEP